MAYTNLQEAAPVAEQRISEMLYNRLTNYNDAIDNMLGNIADKLHQFKNNRLPESKGSAQSPVKDIGDYTTRMNDQLDRLSNLSNRVQDIYNHLDQII